MKITDILNQIAALCETTDKNLVIDIAIKGMVEQGATVKQAYEVIFGVGSYSKLAEICRG